VYEEFYGLESKPFRMTPDPEFLFQSRDHREALAVLRYAVLDNQGFAVLVGEVGTGKTLLLNALLSSLPKEVEAAYLFCPRMDFRDLLRYLLAEFHVDAPDRESEGGLLMRLNDYLTRRLAAGKRTLLVIDEAQNMDAGLLESIRMLSNLETSESKLLQVILAGQPELESMLALPGLRQLRQRVSLKAVIDPLGRAETEEYIRFRMEVAGLEGEIPFTRPALDLLFEYSRGLPRTINVVADNALLIGYAAGEMEIGRDIVAEAIRDLERESSAPVTSERSGSSGRRFLVGAGVLFTIAAAILFGTGFFERTTDTGTPEARPRTVGAAVVPDRGEVPPAEPSEPTGKRTVEQDLPTGDLPAAKERPDAPREGLDEPADVPVASRGATGDEDRFLPDRRGQGDPTGIARVPSDPVPARPEPKQPRPAEPERLAAKPVVSDARTLRVGIAAPRMVATVPPEPDPGAAGGPGSETVSSAEGGETPSPGGSEESAAGTVETKKTLLLPVNIPRIFAPPASSRAGKMGGTP